MLDNSKGSRKRGKRVLEIFKGPKTLLGSKTLFPLTPFQVSNKSTMYLSQIQYLATSIFFIREIHFHFEYSLLLRPIGEKLNSRNFWKRKKRNVKVTSNMLREINLDLHI